MKSILIVCLVLFSACKIIAQESIVTDTTGAGIDSVGIMLENYQYPFPVKYMHITTQNMKVVMAYMDIKPANYNGKSVLLLHGKNFPAAYWKETIDVLAGEGYRVIAPDQLGFGKSSKPIIHYSFALLAQLTVQLLDTLNIQKVAIIGHSTGGMLAARLAINYPGIVTKLILTDPLGLEDYKKEGAATDFNTWYTQEKSSTYQSILKVHRKYYVTWNEVYQQWANLQYGMTKSKRADQLARVNALTYQMIVTQPVLYEFNNIKAPTLIIYGENDHTKIDKGVKPEVSATMGNYKVLAPLAAKKISHGLSFQVDRAGHLPQFENPEIYFNEVKMFLKDLKVAK